MSHKIELTISEGTDAATALSTALSAAITNTPPGHKFFGYGLEHPKGPSGEITVTLAFEKAT